MFAEGTDNVPFVREEMFDPVVMSAPAVKDTDEVTAQMNDALCGLPGEVFAVDCARAHRVANLAAGSVWAKGYNTLSQGSSSRGHKHFGKSRGTLCKRSRRTRGRR